MDVLCRRLVVALLICSLTGASSMAMRQEAQSVSEGVYSDAQAQRGQTVYRAKCASCHGQNLEGRNGPPLAGDDFLTAWSSHSLLELANKIRNTMPRGQTERLTPQESADVLAYILQVDKFPSGRSDLAMDEAELKRVTFPARPGAPARPALAASGQPHFPAFGNVGQVMRGILFPSANIIFTVQTIDPGVKRPPVETTGGGFDWLAWGGSVYPGWEVVDYAAVSLAESAELMLTPGRRCENGRPVPVSDPDWIKFTNELAEAGKAAFKASQTRNQAIVSESTNQLNDSCQNCHRVFRGRTHCAR